jgi:hypothetical protein
MKNRVQKMFEIQVWKGFNVLSRNSFHGLKVVIRVQEVQLRKVLSNLSEDEIS